MHLTRRLLQLYAGLILFGFSVALVVQSALGNSPWDVLHQGLSRQVGLGTGTWAILLGVVVLLLWIPLRQRPGLGTVSNVVVVGLVMEATFALIGEPSGLAVRALLLLAGIVLNGVATGMYIGASFGPGPRDGLMTGLAQRGLSIRAARTTVEVTVLVSGAVLGGTVGVGTVLYAVSIGPLAHVFLPAFTVAPRAEPALVSGT
jgi:uncharacterized membrane protein YczE